MGKKKKNRHKSTQPHSPQNLKSKLDVIYFSKVLKLQLNIEVTMSCKVLYCYVVGCVLVISSAMASMTK